MSIIGFHVDEILPYGNATIFMGGRVIEQSGTLAPLVMPQDSAGSRIQREDIVGGHHIHASVHDYRRGLKSLRIAGAENPCRPELRDIGCIDFAQAAVAATRVIAIV